MERINCLIVSDDIPSLDKLSQFIGDTGVLQLVGAAQAPGQAKEMLEEVPVDLLLLDLKDPTSEALDLINGIDPRVTKTIVISKDQDPALEAFVSQAADYLTWPFTYSRFLKAAGKVLEKQFGLQTRQLRPTPGRRAALPEHAGRKYRWFNPVAPAFSFDPVREAAPLSPPTSEYLYLLADEKGYKILSEEQVLWLML
jgi:DNA-binding NtrC family response regulator